MFRFLEMMGNYEDRKVDRFEEGKLMVSTANVNDGKQPYETAICHSEYNNGEHIIVEGYDSKDEAQKGHDEWVKRMTNENLPDSLIDCANSEVQEMCGGLEEFPRQQKKGI